MFQSAKIINELFIEYKHKKHFHSIGDKETFLKEILNAYSDVKINFKQKKSFVVLLLLYLFYYTFETISKQL